MKTISLLTVLFFTQTALGNLSGDALTTKIKSNSLEAQLKTGFHFNNKAPNMVNIDGQNITPTKLGAREASFNWPQKNYKAAKAYLYICDDAKTFCEPRTIELKSDKNPDQTSTQIKKSKVKINSHGFIEDDIAKAQEMAKKQKSLLLVDFAARWCPGCVRLETEVFDQKDFKKSSQALTKIRIDYDKFENLSLAKKYNIKFIPTLLILNSDLEEISRLVDYQPLKTVQSFIQNAQAQPASLAALQIQVDQGEKTAAITLGQRFYAAGDFENSVKYLSQVSPEPIELRDAQVQWAKAQLSQNKIKKSALVKVVAKAVAAEPQSTRSLSWRTLWIENISDKNEKKKIAQEGLKLADDLLQDQTKLLAATAGDAIGEFTGYESLLVASRRADLLEAAESDKATIQESYVLVAEIGQKLKISPKKEGPALRYLIFLVAAQKWQEADQHVRAMLKLDPQNPELLRRHLRVLIGQEKFSDAITVGRKTLPNSFGKNEVWVAMQLAKAYAGNKQNLEAKALAQTFLSRTDIDWSAMTKEKAEFQSHL